ncbi:MAG: hypothetical protein JNL32_07010, partial [Candidatus Kapabacteria bacterium]|nr:hypothetical protein [Candidatus Kapabacteria bacterium]
MKRSIVVIILFALCSMCLSQAQEIVWRSELPKGFIDVEATDSGDKVAVLAPSGIWFYRTSLHSTKPNTNRYIRNDTSVIRGNMDSSWRILLHPTVEKAFVSVGLNVYSCNVDTTANPYGFYSFKATAPKLSDAPFGNIAKYVDHSNHLFVYPGIEYGTPDFQQAGYAFNPVSDSIERYGYVIAQNPKTHDKLLREIRFQYHKYNIIAYRDTLKIVTSKHSRIVRYVDAHPDDCIITDDGQYIIYKDKVHHWSSSTDVRTNAPIGVVLSSRFKA